MEFLARFIPGHEGRVAKRQAEEQRKKQELEEKRQQAKKLLFALVKDVKYTGYELADALQETVGKGSYRSLDESQAYFETAIAHLTGVNEEEIRYWKQDLPFLRLDQYAHWEDAREANAIDVAAVNEAFFPSSRGGSVKERDTHDKQRAQTHADMQRSRGYDERSIEKQSTKTETRNNLQRNIDAAILSLREHNLEAGQQFEGIEERSLAGVLTRAEIALTHPSIRKHMADASDAVCLGVKEVIFKALHQHVQRLADSGEQTITGAYEVLSMDSHKPISRQAHQKEMEAHLDNDEDIRMRGKVKKDSAERKTRQLRNIDLLLTEMERYAKEGPAAIQTKDEEATINRAYGFAEAIDEQDPESLHDTIRWLVQSIPQKDMQQALYMEKNSLHKLLSEWSARPFNQKTQEDPGIFAQTFSTILSAADGDWKGSYVGRDKLPFFHRDIQAKAIKAKLNAQRPVKEFEKEVRQNLESQRQDDIEFLKVMEDLEDICSPDQDIQRRLANLGNRLGEEGYVKQLQEALTSITDSVETKYRYAREHPNHYIGGGKNEAKRFLQWLEKHPMRQVVIEITEEDLAA